MKNILIILIILSFIPNCFAGDNNIAKDININININGEQTSDSETPYYSNKVFPIYSSWYVKPNFLIDDNCCHPGIVINGCTCLKQPEYIKRGFK